MGTVEAPSLDGDLVKFVCDICAQASRTKDGRPDKSALMRATGYSGNVVSSSYPFRRTPEVRRNILCAFADLYKIDAGRLLRYDERRDDEALRALLELERRKMHCTGAGPHLTSVAGLDPGWFDPLVDEELIILSLRLCGACSRRRASRVGDSWREMLRHNAARLPTAINIAIAALDAKGRAPGYEGIAKEAKMSYAEVRSTFAKAGLEKPRKGRKDFGRYLIVPVLWYALSASSAHAAVAETLQQDQRESTLSALWIQLLRRWALADRFRRWLAGLAGPTLAGAPA